MENAFWDGFEKEASWDKRILGSLGAMSKNFGDDAAKAKKVLGELSTQGKLMAGTGAAGLAGGGYAAGRKGGKDNEKARMKNIFRKMNENGTILFIGKNHPAHAKLQGAAPDTQKVAYVGTIAGAVGGGLAGQLTPRKYFKSDEEHEKWKKRNTVGGAIGGAIGASDTFDNAIKKLLKHGK